MDKKKRIVKKLLIACVTKNCKREQRKPEKKN